MQEKGLEDKVSKAEIDGQTTGVAVVNENDRQQADKRILIAYFTRIDNTDAEIDDIIRGGGPYGEIGNSLEDADM